MLRSNEFHSQRRSHFRLHTLLLPVAATLAFLLIRPVTAWAQAADNVQSAADGVFTLPTYWYVLAAGLALLAPAGLVLISVANLSATRAWNAALGAVAAMGLAAFGYWAIGYALQFGGVGLVYTQPELNALVWEWSPLSSEWGIGWGMSGLSGWFLSGANVTSLAYALFLAQLPWVITATLLPVVALRDRAPATATLILALVIGSLLYPLAGNWVQGGGWLNALGRNLNLGHGLVDFGGAGTVHLVAAGIGLAALVVWAPRRPRVALQEAELPPAQLPLLAVVGVLLLLAGTLGWLWANPLQVATLSELALMRGSVNSMLYAAGGLLIPLLYTWFVTGRSDPIMSARGVTAGVVAGLAAGPFVQPGIALLIGCLAGASVPFVTLLVDAVLRLDDATGLIPVSGIPAAIGLLLAGLFADGVVGAGWQMTGLANYLGVTGQGVSGLFVARGFQLDFPGQLQAQVIGVLALALWGFLAGMIVCAPLGFLLHGLRRGQKTLPPATVTHARIGGAELDLRQSQGDLMPVAFEPEEHTGA